MAHPRKDYDHHVRKHASPTIRGVLVVVGTVSVAAGVAGAFLPVLPTTPFLLLAAACYARASRRFYNALLNNRTFGPTILEWQEHRSMAYRTKITAIVLMSLTLATSIVFWVDQPWLQAALALFGVGLAVYMYRIPSRPVSDD